MSGDRRTGRSTDRCMLRNRRRWSAWLHDAKASCSLPVTSSEAWDMCACVCTRARAYTFARPGVSPRDVGGRQMREEKRTGMKAKESGTSARTTGCKMPPSLCTHLHTAFHVCVATCEIQATPFLSSRLSPSSLSAVSIRVRVPRTALATCRISSAFRGSCPYSRNTLCSL